MITTLSFRNFKSWPEAEVSFGRITGFFGTNSSGKSGLLQFLLMLKQTKDATDRKISLDLNGPYVKLGLFKDVIHLHDESRSLAWRIGLRGHSDLVLSDPSGRRSEAIARSRELEAESSVSAAGTGKGHEMLCRSLSYRIGGVEFSLTRRDESHDGFDLSVHGHPSFRFERTRGRPWQLPSPLKSYAFPDQARTFFQNASFLSDIEAAYEENLDNIFYLGPLREYPKRDYLWARSTPQDVGLQGEKAIDAILAATAAGEVRNVKRRSSRKSFQEMIAYWLNKMKLVEQFRIVETAEGSNLWQAYVRARESGPEALLKDVGFGVSQVLPVVTLLQYVPEQSTVILEQPEIHLHPLAQAELADLIINAAQQRRVQVILESHSEHLLLRIQRRVAESGLAAEDVKLYFVDAPHGISKLDPLKLDSFGRIENWPDSFMGDAFGETYAAEEARLKRMQSDAAE